MTEQKNVALMGLTKEQVKRLQEKYGKNLMTVKKNDTLIHKIIHILSEPMFLLLLIAAVIYFILGEPRDGIIMLVFVIGMISIDAIQEWKTDRTLKALQDLSAPQITVIRDGVEQRIASEDLVPGDLMLISEGLKIPADGKVIKANDLCINESTLTGEAEGVWKTTYRGNSEVCASEYWRRDYCYCGTLVTQGNATVLVDKIGISTEYGKIGVAIVTVPSHLSPLQLQTAKLVKTCTLISAALFLLVALLTFFNIPDHNLSDRLIESILAGITLAMAMIPEEFPVVLTVFLSMGAWRLAKKDSLIRKLPAVETLGAVTVLCVDKTGTITINQMTVKDTWSPSGDNNTLYEIMGLGCETDAYDPMEQAMLSYCEKQGITKDHLFGGEFISEYAFSNKLKMMGHVWLHDGEIVIAAKGSPEHLLNICHVSLEEKNLIENKINEMSSKGLRVIGVGFMKPEDPSSIPPVITDCNLTFCGLIGLADPPRDSVKEDIRQCINAGIRVVMITGDSAITAASIANQIGLPHSAEVLTGEVIDRMSDDELCRYAQEVSIFARVVPEHKMRIVNALQSCGEIVAMTGDGVNDAPALKHANIGIAMGRRGSEVSREAADLILLDDNFTTIVDTIYDGRRIYDNIRKAIGYIVTIHIPIAFSALMAPFLNIQPSDLLLLPIHVVLLELIIDPTCSIVLERQPPENNIMNRKPRKAKEKILTTDTLIKSIIQGVAVFVSSFLTYLTMLQYHPDNPALARTMGISIVMIANLFLVIVNSSNVESFVNSIRKLVKDHVFRVVCFLTLTALVIMIYSPLSSLLSFAALPGKYLIITFLIAAASVLWYEIVKMMKRIRKRMD